PYTNPLNIFRFNWPADVPSAHSFTWSPSGVHFESQGATGAVLQQRTITSDVPQPGGENARMNLWLFRGQQPQSRQAVEVVISGFAR
ncbi:MAG: hypothetical protein ACRD96_02130, partial [Bryobacteraceae bacterium]